jgi:invasion protein IalB
MTNVRSHNFAALAVLVLAFAASPAQAQKKLSLADRVAALEQQSAAQGSAAGQQTSSWSTGWRRCSRKCRPCATRSRRCRTRTSSSSSAVASST